MEKQVVIVTGAAGGIGGELVDQFLGKGFAVAMVDIDCGGLKNKTASLNAENADFMILEGDLGEVCFLESIVNKVMEKWGRIDVLVNNAVWRKVESLSSSSIDNWNKTIAISLTAPAFLSKFVAAALIPVKKHCVFVNMSSVMSTLSPGYATAYSVCKGAIESLTYELAVLYGRYGFRSVAIRPGNVETQLNADYVSNKGDSLSQDILSEIEDRTSLGRSASPREIAKAILWISSEEASFITGTTLTIDGGLEHNFNSYSIKKRLKPNEF